MKTLVLDPTAQELEYTLFTRGQRDPAREGTHAFDGSVEQAEDLIRAVVEAGEEIDADHRSGHGALCVGIRIGFGGQDFAGPTPATGEALSTLEELVPQSPLHLPRAINLTRAALNLFDAGRVILVFETAFFTRLPEREKRYGLPPDVAEKLELRRHGFHGLFHHAACEERRTGQKPAERSSALCVLSVCLEPKPEVAAIIGNRPVMVTGGATPLEGIPGETSCGEIDPSLALTIAEEQDWGPERVDRELTQQSGIKGLTGQTRLLRDVLCSGSDDDRLGREVLEYRIQLACGMGIAALGRIDGLLFSGRYADAGQVLGPRLVKRIGPSLRRGQNLSWDSLERPLSRIVADQAYATFASTRE